MEGTAAATAIWKKKFYEKVIIEPLVFENSSRFNMRCIATSHVSGFDIC